MGAIVSYWDSFRTQDGATVLDELYVDHATRQVWNVQEWGNKTKLAFPRTRSDAAKWLSFRHGVTGRKLHRSKGGTYIPHMPVGPYADPTKVVLHGDELEGYGRWSGETVDGARYTQERITADNRDDFHRHEECDEHDPPLTLAQMNAVDNDADQCDECWEIYRCNEGHCDCIEKLEECSLCQRDLGDGDDAWLCLDGGDFVCEEHIVFDRRPDTLFQFTGTLRGEMLPDVSDLGGYTITYITAGGYELCAECASEDFEDDPAINGGTYDEGPTIYCAGCNKEIESSYGDPDEGEDHSDEDDAVVGA